MAAERTLSEWMHQLRLDEDQLVAASSLDRKVVEAIIAGRYTTSPDQRKRIAAGLGLSVQDVKWGQAVDVDHMYGHGPQFGRSP